MRLAAIIPAFDAEPSVAAVVQSTRRQVQRVLVVDDGSSDGTGTVARAAGAEVLVHDTNLGKGAALRSGFERLFAEGFDAVVSIDADGQHQAEGVRLLLAAANAGADLVIGSRQHLFDKMCRLRRCSNRVSSRWISWLSGERLGDIQCGFRLYMRPMIEVLGFPENRFEAESAVVVRAVRNGFRVASVRVPFGTVDGRATSHYRPILDSARIFHATIRARLEPARFGASGGTSS